MQAGKRLVVVWVLVVLAVDPVVARPPAPLAVVDTTNRDLEELGAVSFLQDIPTPSIPTVVLALSLSSSVLLAYVAQAVFAGWSLPPFGMDTSSQTQINVASSWLEIISVFVMLVLSITLKVYRVYRRMKDAGLFHEPYKSASTLDEGRDMMAPMAKANSLNTFLEKERAKSYFVRRMHDATKPMSFTEWNDPKRDLDMPDPVRLLVKLYYVDATALSELHKRHEQVQLDDVDALLKAVYRWRVGMWEVERLSEGVDTEANDDKRKELKLERAELIKQMDQLKTDLTSDLYPAWRNLHRHVYEHQDGLDTADKLSTTESWGSSILAAGMVLSNLYTFLDKSPECPMLLKDDLTIKQHLTRLSASGARAPLPTIHHAVSWSCSHVSSSNVEEGGACGLVCEPGYAPEFGTTLCDSLGGGGMAWTHLNSGLLDAHQLDMPSCCIQSSGASILSTLHQATKKSEGLVEFRWTGTAGFHHACGVTQQLHLQVCAYNPATVPNPADVATACDHYCAPLDKSNDNCFSVQKGDVVPVADWKRFDEDSGYQAGLVSGDYEKLLKAGVVEFEADQEIGDVEVSAPSSWALRARLVSTNVNGVVRGPWREVA